MGTSKPTKIHLVGTGRHEEAVAGGTIKPGHLIMINAAGAAVVHNNVQGPAEMAFAEEDALQGRSIATSYTSGEVVSYILANRGDVIYAWLAGGELAVIGSFLTSNGNGCLQVADDSDAGQFRLAVACEAVDQSCSDDTDDRIRIRVL